MEKDGTGKKRSDCLWKEVSLHLYLRRKNHNWTSRAHSGADFSKIKPTTGTDQTSLIVTCLPLSTANILLRDRMMEFFSASWDASLQMKQAVNESSWFKSITWSMRGLWVYILWLVAMDFVYPDSVKSIWKSKEEIQASTETYGFAVFHIHHWEPKWPWRFLQDQHPHILTCMYQDLKWEVCCHAESPQCITYCGYAIGNLDIAFVHIGGILSLVMATTVHNLAGIYDYSRPFTY